jgi:hypothetical protein
MTKLKSGLLAVVLVVGVAFPAVAVAGRQIPLRGQDVGTFEVPGACVAGVQVVISGAGNASHLGRYAYAATECFDPVAGTFAGSATMIAAGGARLLGTYRGFVTPTDDPNVIVYDEMLTISGGSNHFAGASGQMHIVGWAKLATGDYGQALDGWISRPGS